MAYVKILTIRCSGSHMNAAIAYAAREEKTTRRERLEDEAESRLEAAQTYVCRDEKIRVEDMRIATAIGAPRVSDAPVQFIATKRRWNKTGGRLAYQVIQSWDPGEGVAPELAHEIGVAFVKELFPGYEAVVGTHVDRAHIHNHIIINSVCLKTGRKAHFRTGYIDSVLRRVSDRMCRERGLSVIARRDRSADRNAKREAAGPARIRHFECGTMREAINRDIRWARSRARDPADMAVILEDLGYEADLSGVHTKIRPPEGKRFFRLDTFYTDEELRSMCGMLEASGHGGAPYSRTGRISEDARPAWAPGAGPQRLYSALQASQYTAPGR